jgi:hypothetical protein
MPAENSTNRVNNAVVNQYIIFCVFIDLIVLPKLKVAKNEHYKINRPHKGVGPELY